jgi:hypothetical protein
MGVTAPYRSTSRQFWTGYAGALDIAGRYLTGSQKAAPAGQCRLVDFRCIA